MRRSGCAHAPPPRHRFSLPLTSVPNGTTLSYKRYRVVPHCWRARGDGQWVSLDQKRKETRMLPQLAFFGSIAFSVIAWAIVAARYIWPSLRAQQRSEAFRPLLILHSFRFLAMVFLIPRAVSPVLPLVVPTAAAFDTIV